MEKETNKTNPQDTQSPQLDASFSTLVMSFGVQAYIGLGLTPHPEDGSLKKDKQLAQLNIDFLNLIEEKTKGNLSQQECQLLERVLTDLRMRFIQTTW